MQDSGVVVVQRSCDGNMMETEYRAFGLRDPNLDWFEASFNSIL
jgi:hypothetical protein